MLFIVFVLFIAAAVHLSLILFEGNTPDLTDDSAFTNNIFLFLLVNINIIILSYLVFLIIKNIVKLTVDRRSKVLGSKLRTKLVLSFVGLSAIPALILFWVARGFVDSFIQGWGGGNMDFNRQIGSGYTLMLAGITLLIIFLSIWISLRIAQHISEPLKMLARGTSMIAKGNLSFRLPEMGNDELGTLITSFNTMTKDLKKSREELIAKRMYAERMKAWREVARRIAHEIKNPLTPIQLCAQRIQKRFSGHTAVCRDAKSCVSTRDSVCNTNDDIVIKSGDLNMVLDCCQTIVEQVDKLHTLVNEFSNFARMPKISLAPTQINEILSGLQTLYNEAHADIQFIADLDDALPLLNADKKQLDRVFVNLIDNAVAAVRQYFSDANIKKANAEEKPKITLSTSYDSELSIVVISVTDNGIGIAAKNINKVFEPYFTDKHGGTGLGLPIASSIISDHDGYIRVKNLPSHGTSFVIELPVR